MSGDDSAARVRADRAAAPGDAYALARWITGDRADAEDVVQEACLRAFRPSVAMPAAIRELDPDHRAQYGLHVARPKPQRSGDDGR